MSKRNDYRPLNVDRVVRLLLNAKVETLDNFARERNLPSGRVINDVLTYVLNTDGVLQDLYDRAVAAGVLAPPGGGRRIKRTVMAERKLVKPRVVTPAPAYRIEKREYRPSPAMFVPKNSPVHVFEKPEPEKSKNAMRREIEQAMLNTARLPLDE